MQTPQCQSAPTDKFVVLLQHHFHGSYLNTARNNWASFEKKLLFKTDLTASIHLMSSKACTHSQSQILNGTGLSQS